MPAMDIYAPTVGPTRAFTGQMHARQEGDPVKAARAMLDAAAEAQPPLRLPLGTDAIDGIRRKLASVAAEVDRAEPVARATAFDAA